MTNPDMTTTPTVSVPVEPTPKMLAATWYHEIDKNGGIESQNTRNARIWSAMLAAAPALTARHEAHPEGAGSFSGSLALALEDLSSAAEVVRRMLRNSSDHQSRAFDEAGIPFVTAINRAKLVLKDYDRARAPEASPQVEAVAWVVGNGKGDRWRSWVQGMPVWVKSPEKATRYARREDAEAVHSEDEDAWCVTPHPQPAQTPGVGGDRGPAGAVMDALWPILGGNHTSPELWSEIDTAVSAALTATQPDRTHPTGEAVQDAVIAGFLHGVGRTPWDDMHDYIAIAACDYAKGEPLPASTAKPADGGLLWMMHVRGPDDIYPAPDYATAVAWCDYINTTLAPRVPETLYSAIPALWTGSPARHAEGLPGAIKGWTLPEAALAAGESA